MVDYDAGIIGKSLSAASANLAGPAFPNVYNASIEQYPNPSNVYDAVYQGKYWAGIYTHSGASDRLSTALLGDTAATFYNTSDVITYVWNEARYAAPSDGYLKSSLEQLVQVTRIAYNRINGTGAMQTLNNTDPAAVQVLLNPWISTSINIQPTVQGDRVLYNTVIMVLPTIMQFFFLMAINGISAQFGLYEHLPIVDNGIVRLFLSVIFTFIGSLCLSGAICAFRESWHVAGWQFVCTWFILWLYMHVNFLVMDVATGYMPMKALPFFVLTWVIVNVTSTIFPFELSAGFYRLGYAFPAHETWSVLVQIFSGGAVNRLYQALPILFAYEVVLLPLSKMALHHRCLVAVKASYEEEQRVLTRVEGKGVSAARAQSVAAPSMTDSSYALHRAVTARSQPEHRAGDEYWPSVPVPFGDALANIEGENHKPEIERVEAASDEAKNDAKRDEV